MDSDGHQEREPASRSPLQQPDGSMQPRSGAGTSRKRPLTSSVHEYLRGR